MKTSKYSDSKIMEILKQADIGTPVPNLGREHGMSSATFYKWRAKSGGMEDSMITHGHRGYRRFDSLHVFKFAGNTGGVYGGG